MSHTRTRQVQTSRTLNIYYISANFAFPFITSRKAAAVPTPEYRGVRARINEIRFVFISLHVRFARYEKSGITDNSARTRLFGDRFLRFLPPPPPPPPVSGWYDDNARISAVKKNRHEGNILWARYCFVSIISRRYRWLSCAVGCRGSSIPCGIYDNGAWNKRQRA